MSKNTGNKSTASRKGGNSIWAGLLVGILAGAGMAAGVAWYLLKSPSPYTKEQVKTQSDSTKPPASTAAATEKPAVKTERDKPRFEFYKVLTDKPDAMIPSSPADKSKAAKSQPSKSRPMDSKADINEPQILQAGSFSNVSDAEKLKAKLALLGVEANIQTAAIPDKGVWYRVRLGPYKNTDEMNHARGFLKQNGVDSTPMHAQ